MRKQFFGFVLILLIFIAATLPAPGESAAGRNLNVSGVENLPLSVDPTGRTEGFSAILYNNPNGLPTSEANTITETAEGFIWIGSYAGLIRYDGNTFERIDSTTGIANVRCLFADSQDRLWIGTNDSGVFVMDKGTLHQWDKGDGLKSSSIRAIAEDEDGTIYIGSTVGIAVIDAGLTLTEMQDERIAAQTIREMRKGPDGVVYGITSDGGFFTIRGGKVTSFLSREEMPAGVVSVLPDPETPGKLYIGTDRSQILYGMAEDRFAGAKTLDISPLSDAESMEYIDGQIWVCSGMGIGNLGEQGFTLLENLPMNNSVGHVMTDYEGNLWFTSTRQGVMKVVPNQFSDIFDRCGLDAEVVNSTCLYGDQLFIATDEGLIVTENGKKLESLPVERAVTAGGKDLEVTDLLEYLEGVRIRSVIPDSKGRVWISTWRRYGLLRYDRGEILAFTTEDGLYSDRVRTVSECADGRILAANTGGVSIIEGDQVIGGYGEKDGIELTEILTMTEGFRNDLILGTDGGGIYVIGEDGGVRLISKADGLNSEVILRIRKGISEEVYWIVTSNSLAFMTPDYKVTTIRNFPYPNNYDLYENSKGDIWVLASNGIYVISSKELMANGAIEPVFHGIPSGLPYIATANSYSALTAEGDLYIAGSAGVIKVNIETPFEDVNDLKVAVPFVDADGARIYPDGNGSFVIPAGTLKLTVYSYVFNYSPMNPQVSYHLEGFDSAVITVDRSELAPADYTNLRGGDYRFVMQLKDSMGRGNREVSVLIRKEKAFYEQIWFMVLIAILGIGLIVLAARLYTRKKMHALEKKNHETMTFVKEITEAFAKVVDMKDRYTNGHSMRVAQYTSMLAKELGYDDDTVEKYYRIALLHDVGKIGIPPEVLNKPGKLTDEEFETIKSHTSKGYDALKEISIMPELAVGAEAHHERPDGKGYPNHLKGNEIPRVAQIIAVADCFDAMYSNRPYRNRMNFEKAVSIIKEVSGTQLTSDVVEAFLRLVEKGEFRAPDDHGGGTTENIDNIHKAQDEASEKKNPE